MANRINPKVFHVWTFSQEVFYTQCISAICSLFSNWKLDKTLKSDKDIVASTMDRIHSNKENRLKCWIFCRRDQILFVFFSFVWWKKKDEKISCDNSIGDNFQFQSNGFVLNFFFVFFGVKTKWKRSSFPTHEKNTFDGTFYLIKGFGQHCRLSQYETVGITW